MATKIKPGGKILLLVILVGLSVLGYKMYLDKHPELAKSLTTGQANAMPESTLLLTLSGSNTIGDSLVPALVKAYMEAHSFTDVSIITIGKDEKSVVGANGGKKSRMDISAHGTSTGFASLNAGADICMASAPAPAGSTFKENIMGLDGIAIITPAANQLPEINLQDAEKIFAGEISNWEDVKGANKTGKINVCRMDDNSGTYKMFVEMVMGGHQVAPSAKTFEKALDIVDAVEGDPNSIGFVSYVYLAKNSGIRALPVGATAGIPSIQPNLLTIQSEKYPLCRRLYLYTGTTIKPECTDLLNFIASKPGQDIVGNMGFVNLSINNDNPVSLPGDPAGYTSLIKNYVKITTELRFKFGSPDLDARAIADLDRIITYLATPANSKKQLILAGFTDNVGSLDKNIALSTDRANAVRKLLEQKGATVKFVEGFGPARPVHSNDNEMDRSANRRVEVWMTN